MVTENLTEFGWTALHQCARSDDAPQATLNLEFIHVVDVRGRSSLHVASRYNAVNVIRVLLENKANVNLQAADGNTPLHLAARWGSKDALTLLVSAGGDLHLKNKNGDNVVAVARLSGLLPEDFITMLVRGIVAHSAPPQVTPTRAYKTSELSRQGTTLVFRSPEQEAT
jgi:hypothetical protein